MQTLDPGGVLVLVVDAADNSVFAASERGDRGFVSMLAGLRLPPRVTVVLTARSHRVGPLDVPSAAIVEIQPFDAATSAAHLHRYRADASDADAAEFHARTDGNPRHQHYALAQAIRDGLDMPALLEISARTPDAIFDDLVASGVEVSGAGAGGRRWLALMLALARPVSASTLATALGVEPTAVVAFAHGMTPGVTLIGDAIQFRDEDFESYVRGRVQAPDIAEAHERLADMFLAVRDSDADAAAHVADHLFAAGRLGEVVRLVVDEDSPAAVPDGFRRMQAQRRRIDLAARAAANADDASSAVIVAVRACESASRFDTLSSLVEARLDLVARYTDVDLLRGHALQSTRNEWLAPAHMRMAAALSRDSARGSAARTELEHAAAWLRRAKSSPREDTLNWRLDPDDAACAAEARYRLDGLDAAISELQDAWHPAFATGLAAAFAARVAVEAGPGLVREVLRARGVPLAEQAPFLAHAASPETAPEADWVDEVVAGLLSGDPGQFEPWHGRMVDAAARYGDRVLAAALAQHWTRPLPSHQWEFTHGNSEGVAGLRTRAVAAVLGGTDLSVEVLVPASLHPGQPADGYSRDEESRGHRRREWTDMVGPLLDAAVLAAKTLVGAADAGEVAEFTASAIGGRAEKAAHRWFTFDHSYRAWTALVADAAINAGVGGAVIGQLAGAATTLLRDGAPSLLLELATVLARRGIERDLAADLCFQAAAESRGPAFTASDRLDLLARAADIAGNVDPDLGRELFGQAIDAATGINDEAARLIAVTADLARRSALDPAERPQVAGRLIRAIETIAPYVTDGDVMPYEEVLGAVAMLDPATGLAAACRWDDRDEIRLAQTLPVALLGAIDGRGVRARDALVLDHLIDDDSRRLQYQLDVTDRIRGASSDASAARLTLVRAATWIRRDVPARLQPGLASRLLTWAARYGLDGHVRAAVEPVVQLAIDEPDSWERADPPVEAQALLSAPRNRSWTTLAADAALLAEALVGGKEIRAFISAVADAAPSRQRVAVLAAITGLPDRVGAEVALTALAGCVTKWRGWPGVTEWAATALPTLLTRNLSSLFWWQDIGELADQLRAFGDERTIRRAVLTALPELRPRLTARDWQSIACLLGRLCDADESAAALTVMLADQAHSVPGAPTAAAPGSGSPSRAVPQVLWSAFGHPRREVRWRAAHATRELLLQADQSAAAGLAAELIGFIDHPNPGPFRDPALHFYPLSASAAMLAALARVAVDRPSVLAGQVAALGRHANSGELPHAQIRELARQAAIAATGLGTAVPQGLELANQPTACLTSRKRRHHRNRRTEPEQQRYRFDQMDTIPYWYTPLAQVFDVPVDSVAEFAERWILDKWGLSQDDWWTDTRELRDQRSWTRTSHRHGSIPPEENLRLYVEFHAMMAAAGELADKGQPMFIDTWDDAACSPWSEWLRQYLPLSPGTWTTSLRGPVPAEPELFGHLPPLEAWLTPSADDYDRALGLVKGALPDHILVAAHSSVQRPGAYGDTSIMSVLVAPAHASHLQRALAASAEPMDWKLPTEDDDEFEVDHGPYVLRGWLAETPEHGNTLDEHDPYAQGIRPSATTLPGPSFRRATRTSLDSTRTRLLSADGSMVARAAQWADPETRDAGASTSAGSRLHIDREQLLRYLASTGMSLIVEVRIGRHRHNAGIDGYQPSRSRIYLIDSSGTVTVR